MSGPTAVSTGSAPGEAGATGGGHIFLIAAPSGAGKSSLVNALLQQDRSIRLSVSFTTRAPRPGEAHGREYHFVSLEEFAARKARDAHRWAARLVERATQEQSGGRPVHLQNMTGVPGPEQPCRIFVADMEVGRLSDGTQSLQLRSR